MRSPAEPLGHYEYRQSQRLRQLLRRLLLPWLAFGALSLGLIRWQVTDSTFRLAPLVCSWLLGAAAMALQRLGAPARCGLIAASLYLLGLSATFQAGLTPGAMTILSTAVLVAATVFGNRGLVAGLLATAGAYAVAAFAYGTGMLPAPDTGWIDARNWVNWFRTAVVSLFPLSVTIVVVREILSEALFSGTRYRTLFESSADAVVILNQDRFVECNPAAALLYGYTASELLARSPADVSPPLQPDGRPSDVKSRELMGAALAGTPQRFSWRHERRDGTPFDVEVSLARLVLARQPFLLAIVHDVTARLQADEALRRSEEKFRALIETTGTGYVVTEADGRVLDANAEYARLSGHGSSVELVGRCVSQWTNPPDRERHAEALASCVTTGKLRDLELDFAGPAGGLTPVEIDATVVAEGGAAHVLALCRDISDRRRAEQELRSLHRRLEAIRTEESRRLARRVHDDVGQPLTGLQIELAQLRSQAGQERPELRERIDAASSILRETIETLRGISRELHPRILDDLGLAAAIGSHARTLCQRTGKPWTVDIPSPEPVVGRQQAEALYRVFREAATNVLRHAEAAHVWISLREVGSELELEIEDDGRGIASRPLQSHSLGLLYMREAMRALGGTCSVRSPSGHGTIVTARLPA